MSLIESICNNYLNTGGPDFELPKGIELVQDYKNLDMQLLARQIAQGIQSLGSETNGFLDKFEREAIKKLSEVSKNTKDNEIADKFKKALNLIPIITDIQRNYFFLDVGVNINIDRMIWHEHVIHFHRAISRINNIIFRLKKDSGGVNSHSFLLNSTVSPPNCGAEKFVIGGKEYWHYCTGVNMGTERWQGLDYAIERYNFIKSNLPYIGADNPFVSYFPPIENIKTIYKHIDSANWVGKEQTPVPKTADIWKSIAAGRKNYISAANGALRNHKQASYTDTTPRVRRFARKRVLTN